MSTSPTQAITVIDRGLVSHNILSNHSNPSNQKV